MVELKVREPFLNLVLELLDDPLKKEALLYLICYFQLVKREGNLYVGLDRFLVCAYRNFRNARNYWKDVLVELNLFQVIDLYGMAYTGKDIYKLEEGGIYFLGLKPEYEAYYEKLSAKVVKLWNVLSRSHVYHKNITLQDGVNTLTLLFNEGLYEEVIAYGELLGERYKDRASYFEALVNLSLFYTKGKEKPLEPVKKALDKLYSLEPVFCGVNISKLTRDVEELIRKVEKKKEASRIKVEFVGGKRHKENLFKRLWKRLKGILSKFRRKNKDGYFAQGVLCTRSFRTPYISL